MQRSERILDAPPSPRDNRPVIGRETLVGGLLILALLSVVQRLVGLVRSILFCRWLEPEPLGLWDLAYSFVLLAAPLAVLAIPSAFRRYVEHYRIRGQLRSMICQATMVSMALAILGAACIWVARSYFASLIFGSPEYQPIVLWISLTLIGVIAFHYLGDLLVALRSVRVAAYLQLVCSVSFALGSLVLIRLWEASASVVVVSYGLSCVAASALGTFWLWRHWQELPETSAPLRPKELWGKVLPFAGWVWVGSALANLLLAVDRYLLVHLAPLHPEEVLQLVGQYHAARIFPMLLVGLAELASPVLTPYLAQDWEAGHRRWVSERLNRWLRVLGLLQWLMAVLLLGVGPLIFEGILDGKFAGGYHVLPGTLAAALWFAWFSLAQNYCYCSEQGHWAVLARVAGLVTSIVLCVIFIPWFMLHGAVWAAASGAFVAALALHLFSMPSGLIFEKRTILVLLLPASLPMGMTAHLMLLPVAVWIVWHSDIRDWLNRPQRSGELLHRPPGDRPVSKDLAVQQVLEREFVELGSN